MKKSIFYLFILLMNFSVTAQNKSNELDSISQFLTGVWEIEKVIDSVGNNIETITKEMKGSPLGDEIKIKATGPKMTLMKNGRYKLQFTSVNTDKGFWFLKDPNTLVLQLVTKKGTQGYKMLKYTETIIGRKFNYDKKGNIIENNKRKITLKANGELWVRYEDVYFQIYQKVKK